MAENETSDGDLTVTITFHRGSTGEVWLYVDDQLQGVFADTELARHVATTELADLTYEFEGEDTVE